MQAEVNGHVWREAAAVEREAAPRRPCGWGDGHGWAATGGRCHDNLGRGAAASAVGGLNSICARRRVRPGSNREGQAAFRVAAKFPLRLAVDPHLDLRVVGDKIAAGDVKGGS